LIVIDLAKYKIQNSGNQPKKKILFNINKLNFRKNSLYCFIGPKGSGKTTLLDLICGLLKSQNGTIKFNSKKLELVNLSNLIAYCPQEPFVFSDTIFKNIISERKYNKKLFDMCLNVSCIKQLFKNKADYLNIKLGNNAVNLSGGQKQLINISKTLYQNKQIIIMDEPTSYLSEKISSNLINSLNRIKNNKIIIVCTHNRNLFKYFDEVIDIKKFSNAK
jgi:ABC-type multidrug transport system, ATPase and permease components